MTPSLQPLVFAVSSRASAWRGFDWWQALGQDAGRLAVDLDLSDAFRRQRLSLRSWAEALDRPDVASVWIRGHQVTPSLVGVDQGVSSHQSVCLPKRIVVVMHDAVVEPGSDLNDAISAARRLQPLVDPSTRVALAVTPLNPSGSREHLLRLQSLRHQTAEWDIDLALDLTGRIDESWEAEAAMLRIAKRLAIIRLGYPHAGTPGSPTWHLRRRILSAAADLEFSGIIAIAPTIRPWHRPGTASVALALRQAVADVRSAFRQRSSAVREPIRRRESR